MFVFIFFLLLFYMEDKVGLVWNSFVGAILLLVSVLVYNYYNRTNKTKSEMKEEEKQLSNLVVLIFSPEEQAFARKRRRRKTGRYNRKFPKYIFISK